MNMQGVIAMRYAKGLSSSLANDLTKLGELSAGFAALDELFAIDSARIVLCSHAFGLPLKKELVLFALSEVNAPEVLKNFALIVLDSERGNLLPEIAKSFHLICDALRGQCRGEIFTDHIASKEEVAIFEREMSRLLGKKVLLEPKQDSHLIAGPRIVVASYVLDLSLRHAIEEICAQAAT